jgi:hypothetical protein
MMRHTGESDVVVRSLYRKLGFTNEEGPDGVAMLYDELQL